MKKLLAAFLAIALVFSLTACSNDETGTETSAKTAAAENGAADSTSAADKSDASGNSGEDGDTDLPEYTAGKSNGLLWVVEDEDTVIYLLGTIHVANDTVMPFSRQLYDIIASSDMIAFEADLGDEQGLMYFMANMYYGEGDKLSDHISAELFAQAAEIYAMFGADAETLETLRPWAVASDLMMAALYMNQELGLDPNDSIDQHIYEIAVGAGIAVEEIEGFAFQADLFNAFDDDIMEAYLQEAIDFFLETDPKAAQEEIDSILAWLKAFRDRDIAAFEASYPKDEALDDPFLAALFVERDPNMYAYALNIMNEREGQYLIAVGAGHMIGEGGLVALFIADGYDVRVVEVN